MSTTRTYVVTEGKHWKASDEGGRVCYTKGDTIRLSDEAAESLKGYLTLVPDAAPVPTPAKTAAPAPKKAEPEPEPEEKEDLSDLPWQTVKARVADMESADEVKAVLEAEEAGKKPRQSILEACRVRLEELA